MESRAHAVWQGDLSGSGTTSLESGVAGPLPVTWASRTAAPEGKTSPEELIAAAHAACFSMALSHGLGQAGTPPERLETDAVASFEQVEGGWGFTRMALRVRGTVPGLTAEAFAEAAEGAKENCPVSRALAGNVAISVEAELA